MSKSVETARARFHDRDWAAAFETYSASPTTLSAEDARRFAISGYMLGDTPSFLAQMERAYNLHVEADDRAHALRCAFWISLTLALSGHVARAGGWGSRAERLLEELQEPSVEHGYWLLPRIEKALGAQDVDAALDLAARATAIGRSFSDRDLVALAAHLQGRIEIMRKNVASGLALLDEAMIAVASDELSPIVTGLIYCNVIEGCQEVFAIDRAREWTHALAQWCDAQPTMVAFTGKCLVHRAEILCVQGDWPAAASEATQAHTRLSGRGDAGTEAAAVYQQAELHRLRGEHEEAETAYTRASNLGRDPQPGLALLRLAQGDIDTAVAGVERLLADPAVNLRSAKPLAACVEIMLAANRLDAAAAAAEALELIAHEYGTNALTAMSTGCRGAVLIEQGHPEAAVPLLRDALASWHKSNAPHAAAQIRVWLGTAYRALGDEEGCQMEFAAAREGFEELGAKPEIARLAKLTGTATPNADGLTEREVEVLRLVAAGMTNKEIAVQLDLSVRTVDRHVSNIFGKIGATTRSAATAFAYQRRLV